MRSAASSLVKVCRPCWLRRCSPGFEACFHLGRSSRGLPLSAHMRMLNSGLGCWCRASRVTRPQHQQGSGKLPPCTLPTPRAPPLHRASPRAPVGTPCLGAAGLAQGVGKEGWVVTCSADWQSSTSMGDHGRRVACIMSRGPCAQAWSAGPTGAAWKRGKLGDCDKRRRILHACPAACLSSGATNDKACGQDQLSLFLGGRGWCHTACI